MSFPNRLIPGGVFNTAILFLILLLILLSLPMLAGASVVGKWNIFDANTQSVKSVILIRPKPSGANSLSGTLIKLHHVAPVDSLLLCEQCRGELKNEPVVGLELIKNLTMTDGERGRAEILNPDNGKWYSVSIELDGGHDQLTIKNSFFTSFLGGYYGSQLVGESMVLQRVK